MTKISLLRTTVGKNSKPCYHLYSVCLGHKTLCTRLTARGLQESRQHVTFNNNNNNNNKQQQQCIYLKKYKVYNTSFNPCIWRGSLNGLSLALSNRIVFLEFSEAKVIVWNLTENSDLFRVSPLTCDSKQTIRFYYPYNGLINSLTF